VHQEDACIATALVANDISTPSAELAVVTGSLVHPQEISTNAKRRAGICRIKFLMISVLMFA